MNIQESGEMYLETILILSKNNNMVRAIDISEYMNFSKPSVSRAVGLLKNGGFISIENNGNIKLTDTGLCIAQSVFEKHNIITDFLVMLGVDLETASKDACRIEHVISEKSFAAIKKHAKDL